MKKLQLRECYFCYCASSPTMDVGAGKCTKQKLPRKKKKRLKSFLLLVGRRQYRYFMDHPTSCDLADEYKNQKPLFHLIPLLNNRAGAVNKIFEYGKNSDEGIYFDNKGRLSWYWENDDDYCGSSGVMPFCYSPEEAGNTWAFNEVERLIRWLQDYPSEFIFPVEVKDDKSLIEYIHRNLKQFTINTAADA